MDNHIYTVDFIYKFKVQKIENFAKKYTVEQIYVTNHDIRYIANYR